MKAKFNKRLYHSFGEFTADLREILSHREQIKVLMSGAPINPSFRERLMMAVTEVNGCRYCNYYHSRLALEAGISAEELAEIGAMSFASSPLEEQPALLYAQHWAEHNAQPDPDALQRIQYIYGKETTDLIHLSMRMIRVGNLTGNLLDYILFILTFGRVGGRASV
jgi:AhpD family alkylhydroperoxidase